MFKDERRYEVWEQIRQQDLRAFARLLPQSLLIQAAKQADVRIVRSALAIPNLVWLGLLAALHSTKSFTKVLSLTVRMLDMSANGLPEPVTRSRRNATRRKRSQSKHNPQGKDPAEVTEEAFAQARQRMPAVLWNVLIELPHPTVRRRIRRINSLEAISFTGSRWHHHSAATAPAVGPNISAPAAMASFVQPRPEW